MSSKSSIEDSSHWESTADLEHPRVHEEYSFADADLVLSSCDGHQFRVHSCVMKQASGVFKNMLETPLPMGQTQNSVTESSIPLQENGDVLKALLDVAYPGRSFFNSEDPSFELLQEICTAADKYEMPGAQRILQMLFRLGLHSYPPIPAFTLACRCGWEQERKLASTKTLAVDLRSPESRKQLKAASSSDVIDLHELHMTRRDLLVAAFDLTKWSSTKEALSIHWSSVLGHLCLDSHASLERTCTQSPSWMALIYRVSERMEKCPLGTFVQDPKFWDLEEFKQLWALKCSNDSRIIDRKNLASELLRVLENLPKTV